MDFSAPKPDESFPAREASDPPDWAIAYARAAIRCGQQVPHVERHLVDKGLPPTIASAAVDRGFDVDFQTVQYARRRRAIWKWVNRIAALLVMAAILLMIAPTAKPGQLIGNAFGYAALVALIWFGGALGRNEYDPNFPLATGREWGPTPGFFFILCGWLLLLGVPLLVVLLGL